MNKVDLICPEELELMHQDPHMVPIAANEKWCLDALIEYCSYEQFCLFSNFSIWCDYLANDTSLNSIGN